MNTIPVPVTGMTFDDEFNSFTSSPDGSSGTWMTSYPYGGEAARTLTSNDEAEYFSDSSVGKNPFSLSNGVLSINATPATPGSNPYNLPYDSGLITTDKSFSQTYGYFEVSAELPGEQGLWPAFWLLPSSNVYTSELDVFEQIDSADNTIYSTVHGTTAGTFGSDSQALAVPDVATGFHTYGVDWEPTTTTFYVDGKEIGSAPTPSSMDTPMYMLLDLAVGGAGSWPGAPNSGTVFPASMRIDYVRAYATANTVDASGSAAINNTPVVIGSGNDTLALSVAEDAWQGDAQFTISVDGTQIGGIQTATASNALGATQTFDVRGSFAAGPHAVVIDFLNDTYGGSASEDRNLYVTGASIDGAAVAGSTLSLMSGGPQSFSFTEARAALATSTTATTSAPIVIGSGADTLVLSMAEDAWQGDARFTIQVDGVQVGGVQNATASHAAGASQTYDVMGNFAAGQHTVSVDFLNDAYGGTATEDRNLYVTGASIDGTAVAGGTLSLMSSGTQSFSFGEPGAAAVPASPDTLTLQMAEDAWQGDAEYTVSVDGTQVGGVRSATASHAGGASQTVALSGDWGSGAHTVGISFINDAYGGSAATDRNLYVDGVSYDGQPATPATATLMSNGTATFNIPPTSTLTLQLAEDAYQGDAHYSVAVDGKTLVAGGTVSASEALGQTQSVSVMAGSLSAGTHDLAISFLNDLYGGSSVLDRNLYVKGVELNGSTVPGSAASLYSNGTEHLSFVVPAS